MCPVCASLATRVIKDVLACGLPPRPEERLTFRPGVGSRPDVYGTPPSGRRDRESSAPSLDINVGLNSPPQSRFLSGPFVVWSGGR